MGKFNRALTQKEKGLKELDFNVQHLIHQENFKKIVGEQFYDETNNLLRETNKRILENMPEVINAIDENIKTKLIDSMVEEEKDVLNISLPKTKVIEVLSSEDEEDLPPKVKPKYEFPHVNSKKMKKFLKKLDSKQNESNKDLKNCLGKMTYCYQPAWNLPQTVMRAINHSILHRKWNNLTQLLRILLHYAKNIKYKPLVYQYCDYILNKYHPLILESGIKDECLRIVKGSKRNKV